MSAVSITFPDGTELEQQLIETPAFALVGRFSKEQTRAWIDRTIGHYLEAIESKPSPIKLRNLEAQIARLRRSYLEADDSPWILLGWHHSLEQLEEAIVHHRGIGYETSIIELEEASK